MFPSKVTLQDVPCGRPDSVNVTVYVLGEGGGGGGVTFCLAIAIGVPLSADTEICPQIVSDAGKLTGDTCVHWPAS